MPIECVHKIRYAHHKGNQLSKEGLCDFFQQESGENGYKVEINRLGSLPV